MTAMTELRDRFRTLDGLSAPDLWFEITQRTAMPQSGRERGLRPMNRFAPLAVAATAVVIAILIGIGILVRPPDVGPSPVPGPSRDASPVPTEPGAAAWTTTGSMVEVRTRLHGHAPAGWQSAGRGWRQRTRRHPTRLGLSRGI